MLFRSIKVVLGVLANAIAEATGKEMVDYITEEDKANAVEVKEEKELKSEAAPVEEKKPAKKETKKETVKEEKSEKKPAKKETEKEEVKETKKTTKKETKEDLDSKTVAELKEMAKAKGVEGYSKLKKAELIEALK